MSDHSHSTRAGLAAAATATAAVLLDAAPALAHHPMGGATPSTFMQGLLSGLAHPVIDANHLLFLVLVAALASRSDRVPGALAAGLVVVGSAVGTLACVGVIVLPFAEAAVAFTLVAAALLLATRRAEPSTGVVAAILSVSGFCHGFAYGESVVGAESTPLAAYVFGLVLVQLALVVGGAGFARRLRADLRPATLGVARGALVAAGLAGGIALLLQVAAV